MLDSLYIKNFRLFKELQIKPLKRVNLFVGRNNAGKTGLLEALWIYGSNANPTVLEKIIAQRDENWEKQFNLGYGKNHPLQYFFHNDSHPSQQITIAPLNSSHQQLSMAIVENEKFFPEMTLSFQNYPGLETPKTLLLKDYPPTLNFPNFPNSEHTQFVGTAHKESQEIEDLWNDIFVTPLEEHILTGLHLFDDRIQKAGLIVKSGKNIPVIFIDKERIPLKHLGEGMSRVFYIMLALVNAGNGFLLIDEFEHGLHYTVQSKVWELIFQLAKELNIQVFATTHSQDCVESFHAVWETQENEGTFYRLDNDPNEGVSVMPYDCEILAYALETDGEMR